MLSKQSNRVAGALFTWGFKLSFLIYLAIANHDHKKELCFVQLFFYLTTGRINRLFALT